MPRISNLSERPHIDSTLLITETLAQGDFRVWYTCSYMEGTHFNQAPKTPERNESEDSMYALQTTLTPEAWELFETFADMRISHEEFLQLVKEFNELGEAQLDEDKLDGLGENLAEREMNSVPMTLPMGRHINISRSMRGVFTISA